MEATAVDVFVYVNTGTTGSPVWTKVSGQKNASLTRGTDMIDVTTKDSNNHREEKAGIRHWEISCDGLIPSVDTAYQKLINAWQNGDYVYLQLHYADGSYKSGTAHVSELSEEYPFDGESEFSASFSGTGQLS